MFLMFVTKFYGIQPTSLFFRAIYLSLSKKIGKVKCFCSNIVLKVEIILYDFTIKIEPKLIKVTLNHFTMSGGYVKEKEHPKKGFLAHSWFKI